ncbi:zinc-binding dehydrogenase [Caldalkalibacillus mannanilyticus]|uniref:L-erythro-3,5-diaminohexanoate dehydrogenase n=1 Tax=Caldalkalibacillus mannanilyticus TaxID=1418 RepID=UPI000AECCC6C|nr:zinc-binding dehydrogenase [Caldalkalibacillus mannanilyticus]
MQGHRYGCHRVIEPQGSLPQPAWRLDASSFLYDNELLIEVDVLNIDSASFLQLKEEAKGEVEALQKSILSIVEERGKLHNPVTGSGGMLIGRVKEIGANYGSSEVQVGDRIATLVSLTLTPLSIQKIHHIDLNTGQIKITGEAILFQSGIYALLPGDLPEALSLAVLDVCGAPAQVDQLVQEGDTVLILGAGGKSGLLSTYQAKKRAGSKGKVIAMEYGEAGIQLLEQLQLADHVIQGNARDAVKTLEQVEQVTAGALADVVINCVNVPQTEMSSILCTKERGITYFFSMATSFSAAALGAEG